METTIQDLGVSGWQGLLGSIVVFMFFGGCLP